MLRQHSSRVQWDLVFPPARRACRKGHWWLLSSLVVWQLWTLRVCQSFPFPVHPCFRVAPTVTGTGEPQHNVCPPISQAGARIFHTDKSPFCWATAPNKRPSDSPRCAPCDVTICPRIPLPRLQSRPTTKASPNRRKSEKGHGGRREEHEEETAERKVRKRARRPATNETCCCSEMCHP